MARTKTEGKATTAKKTPKTTGTRREAAPKTPRPRKEKTTIETTPEAVQTELSAEEQAILSEAPEGTEEEQALPPIDYSDQGEFEDMDWRTLEFHPLANLFPMLSEDDLTLLGDDIRRNGLLNDIELAPDESDGDKLKILDGRNRYTACVNQGIRPRFRKLPSADFSRVISVNLRRRHMTQSQKACMGAKLRDHLEKLRAAGAFEYQGDTRDLVGSIVGVSGRYIDMAAKLLKDAPDLFQVVEDGGQAISQAMNVMRDRKETDERDNSEGGNRQGGASVEPTLYQIPAEEIEVSYSRVVASGGRVLSRKQILAMIKMLNHYIRKYGLEYPSDLAPAPAETPAK